MTILIACKIEEDEYPELARWFTSIKGNKSAAVRDVLVKGLSGGNNGNHQSPSELPPDTLTALLQSINNLPQALSLALVPVLMQIASAPGAMPPPSANYVPAYEIPERAYQIKRPSLEASFERSQAIIETAEETAEEAEEALNRASNAFVNMFG